MAALLNTKSLNVGFLALLIVSVLLLVYHKSSSTMTIFGKVPKSLNFTDMLAAHSSPDKFIILAMTDYSFRDMAVNLYETSFKRHGIKNFLFVGNGGHFCEFLSKISLPCFHYTNDTESDISSAWGTPAFTRKMNIRTRMILEALHAGFTVLHTDVDVVFLKNPLPELQVIIQKSDMAILWDDSLYNAGFLVIKPTTFSINVYETIWSVTEKSPKTDDQKALNDVLPQVRKRFSSQGVSVVTLNRNKYLCGVAYYEQGNRIFPAPCADCMVVHNNWIVSREAKIYRFKEHLTWMYDEDAYYTSKTRKYISYSNPLTWISQKETEKEELDALKAALALGVMLNRTVILPRFHCDGKECPLNSLLLLAAFDKTFADKYRESCFLQNPLVPESVRSKRNSSLTSHLVVTQHKNISSLLSVNQNTSNNTTQIVLNKTGAMNEKDIRRAFGNVEDSVLEFHNLYGLSPAFSDQKIQTEFEQKIKEAFKRKCYRQLAHC